MPMFVEIRANLLFIYFFTKLGWSRLEEWPHGKS